MNQNPSDPTRIHQDPEATLIEAEDLNLTRKLPVDGPLKSNVPILVGRAFGRFQITGLLGVGGMGTVFSAWDPATEREVALKVLNQTLETTEAREAFLSEGAAAAAIRHERVVFVFSAEEVEGRPVLSMELVSGGTLAQKVQRDGPLPAAQVVTVLLDLIDALVAAQAAGVLHRDIKPSNCYLDSKGRVKLGDFGISQIGTQSSDSAGKFVSGTPAYGAPEQLLSGKTDVRSDLYSLGATACMLLTGHAPYERPTLAELMQAIDRGGFTWPKGAFSPVPQNLSKAIERCLARHPQDRFHGYADLREALDVDEDFVIEPAQKKLRSGAWLIDGLIYKAVQLFILFPVTLALAQTTDLTGGNPLLAFLLASALLLPAYFIWTESQFGSSIGKRILRLKVIGIDGARASIKSNMVRTLALMGPFILVDWIFIVLVRLIEVRGDAPENSTANLIGFIQKVSMIASIIWMACMFLRATPGRGWHDVWAGTYVVRRRRIPRASKRTQPGRPESAPPTHPIPMADAKRMGPYSLLGPLTTCGQWWVALDPLLNRRMWVRLAPTGAEPIEHSRRRINRPGRLRWVNGSRNPQQSWDAYEAPDLVPWKATDGSPAPWEVARFWLKGAIMECSQSRSADEAAGPSGVDAVVLGKAGEFLLLEEPIPGVTTFGAKGSNSEAAVAPRQWSLVVDLAAELKRIGSERRRLGSRAPTDDPWPWYATRFFNELKATKEPVEVQIAMRELLVRQPREGLLKRAQLILTSGGIPASFLIPLMVSAAPPYPLFLGYGGLAVLVLWIGPSLFMAGIAGRRGYAHVREEMQIVDIDGQLATRGRLITRAMVAWSPLTAALSLPALGLLQGRMDTVPIDTVRILMMLAVVLGILSSTLRRSIQDRVAGTWVVGG